MSRESRIWENRPFGSMRGGRESVIGLVPLNPTSPPTLPVPKQIPFALGAELLKTFHVGKTYHRISRRGQNGDRIGQRRRLSRFGRALSNSGQRSGARRPGRVRQRNRRQN